MAELGDIIGVAASYLRHEHLRSLATSNFSADGSRSEDIGRCYEIIVGPSVRADWILGTGIWNTETITTLQAGGERMIQAPRILDQSAWQTYVTENIWSLTVIL